MALAGVFDDWGRWRHEVCEGWEVSVFRFGDAICSETCRGIVAWGAYPADFGLTGEGTHTGVASQHEHGAGD